jgi:hypothetical protein
MSLAAAVLCVACGTDPAGDVQAQEAECPEECVIIGSSRDGLKCSAGDPGCCELGDPTCSEPDGGPTPTGYVTVHLVNALQRQGTFYVDGGGAAGVTSMHEMRWLPAGQSVDINNGMSAPIGSTANLSVRIAAENYPTYTLQRTVDFTSVSTTCTVTATENVDGAAVLLSSCS